VNKIDVVVCFSEMPVVLY